MMKKIRRIYLLLFFKVAQGIKVTDAFMFSIKSFDVGMNLSIHKDTEILL